MGPSGALMIRFYRHGEVRRILASRIAWVLAANVNEWPKGPIKPRDGDELNLRPDNLVMTKPQRPRPFVQSQGGKGSALECRQASDAAIINALAEHQGAFTVPQLSVSVGQSAPCCCVRLAKLERSGLVCGPHCNARKRWNLTPAGQALVARAEDAASAPLILDALDKRILRALCCGPMRQHVLVRELEVCHLTVKRRTAFLIERGLLRRDSGPWAVRDHRQGPRLSWP